MARADISWVRTDAEGAKVHVYAHQVGTRWDFFCRAARHDDWEPLLEPLLDDWLEVLDGVRRRVQRRQYTPGDPAKIVALIRQRFPKAEL